VRAANAPRISERDVASGISQRSVPAASDVNPAPGQIFICESAQCLRNGADGLRAGGAPRQGTACE
jgi:hypothetical protein